MRTIIFSAAFPMIGRPERLAFLENVARSFDAPVRLVAFDHGADAVSETVEVVSGGSGTPVADKDPVGRLLSMVAERFPDKATLLRDHFHGEFGKQKKKFDSQAARMLRLLEQFEATIERTAPDYVYLWNQFNTLHKVFAALLDQKGIRYGFFHDGVLPGSIALDVDGEMGESWVARSADLFRSVAVDEKDIERAEAFLDATHAAASSRHPQVDKISCSAALRLAGLSGRPVVFLAGQNDWHAGIKPKSPDRAHHSPFYAGSLEALAALDAAAGDIGFAVLFKPHPLSKDRYAFLRSENFPNSVILNSVAIDSCIAQASVVATIASQTAYVAALAGKPVVMLGRMQLTGKGLSYDLESPDLLAETLLTAQADPLRTRRRRDMAVHAAQLEKAYLFDYGTLDGTFYRRGPAAAARFMTASMTLSPDEVVRRAVAGQL